MQVFLAYITNNTSHGRRQIPKCHIPVSHTVPLQLILFAVLAEMSAKTHWLNWLGVPCCVLIGTRNDDREIFNGSLGFLCDCDLPFIIAQMQ